MPRNVIVPIAAGSNDADEPDGGMELQSPTWRPESPSENRTSSQGHHPVRDSPMYIRRHIDRLNPQQWGSMQSLTWTSPQPPPFLKDIKTVPKKVVKAGKKINKFIDKGDIYLRTPLPMPEYTNFRLLFTLFDVVVYMAVMGFDFSVAYVHYKDGAVWWFWMTVGLIVVPQVLTNLNSMYWYWLSDHKCATHNSVFKKRSEISTSWKMVRILMHILQVGPLFRYFEILYYGLKSRISRVQRVNIHGLYCPWPRRKRELAEQADYYSLLLHSERDVSMLNLLQSFTQDAPQLVLQIYILTVRPPILDGNEEKTLAYNVLIPVGSCLISLGSLALSLTSYQRVLRFAMLDKPNLSFGGHLFYFLWQSLAIASRVVALALFATQFKTAVFIVMFVHCGVMMLWILTQRTSVCAGKDGKKNCFAEFLFNAVMSWVYVFSMINLKSTPGRLKYIVYYAIYGIENVAMIVLWFLSVYSLREITWYVIPSVVCVPALFVAGIISMVVYYNVYHPDKGLPSPPRRESLI